MQVFGYDCLFTDSFQGKIRKEQKGDDYIKFSRGSSELQRRALLVSYTDRKMTLYTKGCLRSIETIFKFIVFASSRKEFYETLRAYYTCLVLYNSNV